MMMSKPLTPQLRCMLCLLAVSACELSGCLFVHHHTSYIREKEQVRPLTFESPEAQFAFESGVNDLKAHQESTGFNVTAIPLLFWISTDSKLSDNAIYNDQESVCDINGDRLITLQEAAAYRHNVSERLCKQEKDKESKEQTAEAAEKKTEVVDLRNADSIPKPPGLFH
jgi:hypothetical protein